MRLSLLLVLLCVSASGCRRGTPTVASVDLRPLAPPPPPPFVRGAYPRIDLHTHISLGAGIRAVRLLEGQGIVHAVNLSGPPPDEGLSDFIADAQVAYGRITVFTTPNWAYCQRPAYGVRLAADLVRAKDLGARGLKIYKGLGLGIEGPSGDLLAIDDAGLDPLFQKAGELGMPVAIHSGDPKAFWEEPGERNERFDELLAHPEWGFHRLHKSGLVPSWQQLFDAFVRRVGRHPKTTFIGVHFGNNPEDPARIAELLDSHPNLLIDLAARIPAIGRRDGAHDPAAMRAFFIKYQDRVLFATDTGVGRGPDEFMFGSTGREPATMADGQRFFASTFRYLESADGDIPSPTPIQGRWNIDGVALPTAVLEKIYYKNAQRLLGIGPQTERLPAQHRGIGAP